ncbi:MAG: adenylate/guanylate cyclase domain-containing protein [Pirellulales bacterium]
MLRIQVSNKQQERRLEHAAGPLEFGRIPQPGAQRVVLDDPHVSRNQLRIRERSSGHLEVENLSQRTAVYVGDGTVLDPGASREFELPVRLTAGTTLIEIGAMTLEDSSGANWRTVTQPMRHISDLGEKLNLADIGDSLTPETLAYWFETVIAVQRSAAGSPEFYQETARAVVDLVGLDLGLVMLRRAAPAGADPWEVVASHSTEAGSKAVFSRTILQRVLEERRTFFRVPEIKDSTGSLLGVESVVVSPIFDPQDEIVGVVYGLRTGSGGPRSAGIKPLEAQVVQLLAAAVGAGLARVQREAEAARSRVQLEQFVSAEVARELERDPTMLDGRDREVTILFSDIRNFTRLSARLGPVDTFLLVRDVMERLTDCIKQHDGTLVYYIGDGLLAMWNAPADQPNHAELACRAGLAMLAQLPELSATWQARVGAPIALGIGLNTGPARVGNTGSRRRFSYAPLGHTVNLASRVEGATKHLGVPLLITGSTRALLGNKFATRRLCQARLQGIETAVDLCELHAEQAADGWLANRDAYEHGLELYEAGRWAEACREIYPLLSESPGKYDVPSLTLVGRAIDCLKRPPERFDPVVEFLQK